MARIVEPAAAPLAIALEGRRAILITGGSGFIGRRLVSALVAAGHDVIVLTRARRAVAPLPAPLRIVTSLDQLADDTRIDAIVNLAGESISDGLWTAGKRRRIVASRLETTRAVGTLIRRLQVRPKVLVNGSAIGWYGLRGNEVLDESADGRACFSRTVCLEWEGAAIEAAAGLRVVCLRIGLVLAAEGGMLSSLLTPIELGLGGAFGDGRQWMSWIHRDDLVRLIVHAIATPTFAGPVNATAPQPVRNAAFIQTLARALGRPAILAVPAAPLRLLLGRFAEELLLGGQRVMPSVALKAGFQFVYPTLEEALASIVGRSRRTQPCHGTRLSHAPSVHCLANRVRRRQAPRGGITGGLADGRQHGNLDPERRTGAQ